MNALVKVLVVSLCLSFSSSPVRAAEPIEVPPDGYALIYGKEVRLYECWTSGTGETMALQVRSGSK